MDVVVIGGGLAGLSCAVALAERGVAVTVLEERGHLGGRAYSFVDEDSGETVDNGQHAMMGCYHHTLSFLEKIGAGAKVKRQPNLHVEMIHPRRGRGAISCPPLPSPLHAGVGILRYAILSAAERAGALAAGLRLLAMRRRDDDRLRAQTVGEVLRALGQSAHARASFWYPVAIATLNEDPERAAAAPFAEVLARAFFGSRADSQFVLPAAGLSDMYTGDARRYVERRGGRVLERARVTAIELGESGAPRLRLADGATLAAPVCISTVPPRVLDRLLSPADRQRAGLPPLDRFETSPIVSTHLWLDRPVLDGDFVGLLGTATHWVFNRSRLAPSGNGAGQFLSAVISAGRAEVEWETARIAARVVEDLRSLVPAARAATVLRTVVVKEKNATISPTPAAERLRPQARTRVPGLLLAGDWIATGLPPTIESAVQSGHAAAALALEAAAPALHAENRLAAAAPPAAVLNPSAVPL